MFGATAMQIRHSVTTYINQHRMRVADKLTRLKTGDARLTCHQPMCLSLTPPLLWRSPERSSNSSLAVMEYRQRSKCSPHVCMPVCVCAWQRSRPVVVRELWIEATRRTRVCSNVRTIDVPNISCQGNLCMPWLRASAHPAHTNPPCPQTCLPLWLCMCACYDAPRAPPANSECTTHRIDAATRDQGHCRSFSRYIPAGNATGRDIRVSIELQDLQCYMCYLRLRTMLRSVHAPHARQSFNSKPM